LIRPRPLAFVLGSLGAVVALGVAANVHMRRLLTKRVDIIVKLKTGATGLPALRLPLRISGAFNKLRVAPFLASAGNGPPLSDSNRTPHGLTPELRHPADAQSYLH